MPSLRVRPAGFFYWYALKGGRMHEMAITQGIIELCQNHAAGRHILSVEVEIGELSSVVPDAIQFCFEACSSGTLLEGATLTIVRIPGRGSCRTCGADMPITTLYDACIACGEYCVTVTAGEEMRVREIEVDD
jgi:hydrogenase nickel incorporation protein HypA/HybF